MGIILKLASLVSVAIAGVLEFGAFPVAVCETPA